MRWIYLAVLLGASFAAAQDTPVTAPETEQKKIRVEGTILSLNGEAVRKATVRLLGTITQPAGSYTESSDNSGKFVFEEVAPGRYVLSAEKAGFVTTRYGARSNTSPARSLV